MTEVKTFFAAVNGQQNRHDHTEMLACIMTLMAKHDLSVFDVVWTTFSPKQSHYIGEDVVDNVLIYVEMMCTIENAKNFEDEANKTRFAQDMGNGTQFMVSVRECSEDVDFLEL